MTWSALIFRSAGGLSVMNIRPVFEVPPLPPVKAIDVSTAGSAITMFTNCSIRLRMAW